MSAAPNLAGIAQIAVALASSKQEGVGCGALRRLARRSLTTFAAALFGAAALACLLTALGIALAPVFGAPLALVAVAASLLVLGLTALLMRGGRPKPAPVPRAMAYPADLLAPILERFKEHKVVGLLAAVLAGDAAAKQDH